MILCASQKNALANEMSKTAETEILSFSGSGRPLPTWAHCGYKNKLFFLKLILAIMVVEHKIVFKKVVN